jgi:hypothetical protein
MLENEEDGQTRFSEKNILKLYPKEKSLDEIIKALENAENYGRYISNLRNLPYYSKKFNEKFGTPLQRRSFSKGGKVVSTAKAAPYNAEEGEIFLGSLLNQESDTKKATILKSIINWKPSPDKSYLILLPDKKNSIEAITNKVDYVLKKGEMNPETDYEVALEKDK